MSKSNTEIQEGLNRQINLKLCDSYSYLSMSYHFHRDDVDLPGLADFFMKLSEEEREHANLLMKYQNKSGGRIVFQHIKKPAEEAWGIGPEAMQMALQLKQESHQSLLDLQELCKNKKDARTEDFIKCKMLVDQVGAIEEITAHIEYLRNHVGADLEESECIVTKSAPARWMIPSCLDSMNPEIKPLVEVLLTPDTTMLRFTDGPILVTDLCSGCLTDPSTVSKECESFKLTIPYAKQNLTWQVIFNPSNLKEPPCFVFQEDEDFCPPLEQMESLICWDCQRRESLANVLAELLELYKEYKLKKEAANIVPQIQTGSLLEVSPESLQAIVNKKEQPKLITLPSEAAGSGIGQPNERKGFQVTPFKIQELLSKAFEEVRELIRDLKRDLTKISSLSKVAEEKVLVRVKTRANLIKEEVISGINDLRPGLQAHLNTVYYLFSCIDCLMEDFKKLRAAGH